MKSEDPYHCFVRWSEEDQCYIGYCPDLYFGGVCHGENEADTYAQLCSIILDETEHRSANAETLAAMNESDEDLPRYATASQAKAALGL
jgi:hypothetical protein